MGFISRKFIILIALAVAVSGSAIAKTNDSKDITSKPKSSLTKKKKASKLKKIKKTKATTSKARKITSSRAVSEGKEQYKNITVNINKADAAALSAYLPGIGVVKATEIVKYRRANGKFKSLQDLVNVDGVGEATLDAIKKNVSLSRGKVIAPEGYVMDKLPKSNKKKKSSKSKPRSTRSTDSEKSNQSQPRDSTISRTIKDKKLKKKKILKKKKLKKKATK